MTLATLERTRHKARQQAFDDNPRIAARAQRLLEKTRHRLAGSWAARPAPSTRNYADVMWM